MFKLKISQLDDFEKSNNKRTDFITYFEDKTDAKKAFNYVLQEQARYIINQKENYAKYEEYETNLYKEIEISKCKNSNILALKKNQIWIKLFSPTKNKEVAIMTFKYEKDFRRYIETYLSEYDTQIIKNNKCYFNKFNEIVYAIKYEKGY